MHERARILVVDDEPRICRFVKELLESERYWIDTTLSGIEALDMIEKCDYQLLISDMKMPGIDGFKLFKQAKISRPDMATIILTGYATVENAILALRLGIDDYITKPFNINELKKIVEQTLNTHWMVVENKELFHHLKEANIELSLHKQELINKVEAVSQHLYECNNKLKQRVNEIATIDQIGKTITATLDMEELLGLCLELINDRLEVSNSSVMLLDEKTDILIVKAVRGDRREQIIGVRQKVGRGIAGWVAKHRKHVLVRDIDTDSRFTAKDRLPYKTKSFVSSPLSGNNRLWGVINAADKLSGEDFSESDTSLLATLATPISIAIENIRLCKTLEGNCLITVKALATSFEAKCPYTSGHSQRVTDYALRIADILTLSKKEKDLLRYATQLHDIGKVGILESILNKPGKLTPDEFDEIRKHPVIAEKILAPLDFLKDTSYLIRNHHEHWDGSGYPDSLNGHEIPLLTRIMTIADAFDAITSERTYKPSKPQKDALLELNSYAGRQFDPEIVHAFISSEEI
ncbi:MAG: HD domain-containing phosphohydrolase [Candidatus Brocadiales bacterium]